MNTAAYVTFLSMMRLCHQVTCLTQFCHPGTFLWTPRSGPDVCVSCTEGVNFMPQAWHTNRACFDCTKIQDPHLEILVTECNRTHDAVILCRSDYYRRKARNGRQKDFCKKCYECENPTLPCHDTYDTVCCGLNYEVALNKDGVYVCKELPILCHRGQYLDTSTEQCRTCPSGTYMTEDSHNNTACNICQTPQSHQVILQACNSTHPTIIGCEDGYFRDRVLEQAIGEVICLPCHKCHHHERRACDKFHNTVCCSEPHMIVVDTDDGPECKSQIKKQTSETTDVGEAGMNHTAETTSSWNDSQTSMETDGKICRDEMFRRLIVTVCAVACALTVPAAVIMIPLRHKILQNTSSVITVTLLKMKLVVVVAEVSIFVLALLCLLLVAGTSSPGDITLWFVVVVLVIIVLVGVYTIISTCLYKGRDHPKSGLTSEPDEVSLMLSAGQDTRQVKYLANYTTFEGGRNVCDTEPTEIQPLMEARNLMNRLNKQQRSQEIKTEEIGVLKDLLKPYEVNEHYAKLESAINQGADVNAADDTKKTMLMYAAEHGHNKFLRFLLSRNADVNMRDTYGNTALAYAAQNGHAFCVEKLIDCGASKDINIPNRDGVTPLMLAVSSSKRKEEFQNLFIKTGADVHMRDIHGNTALAHAVKKGHVQRVKALIEAGADKDINILNKKGITAIMLAVSSNGDNDKLLDILMQAGADVNVRDREGNTLLALAGKCGNEKCVSVLIEAGLKRLVNSPNRKGVTPLMLAVSSNVSNNSCPEILIRAGADIQIKDNDGNTALVYAYMSGNEDYIEMLRSAQRNYDGDTPLLLAAYSP